VRLLRLLIALLVWTVGAVPLSAEERDSGDFVRVLEEGPREKWNAAARQIVQYSEKYDRYSIDARALGSLLRRWDALLWDTHELIAKGMQSRASTNTPEAVVVFARLLADPKPRI
jgi:hypothetical protein